jgi:hypothetical protein
MKRSDSKPFARCLWAFTALLLWVSVVRAQTTTFTYQGQLTANGVPTSGTFDMQFALFDAATAGNQIGATLMQPSVPVTNGAFTTQLDFGAAAFPGADRFLEIRVRAAGSGTTYTVLPRTQTTSTPYAIRAANATQLNGLTADRYVQADAAGNVGIGTTSPTRKLTVQTGTNAYGFTQTDGTTTVGSYVGTGSGASGGWLGTLTNDQLHFFVNGGAASMTIDTTGNVGIGTSTPTSLLDISGVAGGAPGGPFQGLTIEQALGITPDLTGNMLSIRSIDERRIPFVTSEYFLVNSAGRVGVGTATPHHKLSISGGPTWTNNGWVGALELDNLGAIAWRANSVGNRFGIGHTTGGLYFFHTTSDPGTTGSAANYDLLIKDNGHVSVNVLEIQGGADLSEKFDIGGAAGPAAAEPAPLPGLLVSIDPQHPGKLRVSDHAYDRGVAGVISGAGGVQPGMVMGQAGSLASGQQAVALNGRVYCWADASGGPITPGDLLTTSDIPGHAMRVTDYERAHGAIVGKAMTDLAQGKGLVLVLVTLQ